MQNDDIGSGNSDSSLASIDYGRGRGDRASAHLSLAIIAIAEGGADSNAAPDVPPVADGNDAGTPGAADSSPVVDADAFAAELIGANLSASELDSLIAAATAQRAALGA